jgi:DNA-binding CsgD family transcriptional regulator
MAIHEDRLGNLWIGTRDSGIYILTPENRETGVFTPLPNLIDDPHGLSHPYIRAIYEDQEGTIWVGTYSGGLNRYDRSQNRFVYYRFRENDPTSISSDCVMSILEDRAGNMWIGTGNAGLNKFDRESGTFKWYTRQDGLPDHMIYGMLEDERGNLWLSTNRGLSKFDPKKETFVNFSARDGLQDNEFNADAYYKNTATGQLFFGGIRGITTFHPRAIKMNNHIPPVQITSFRVLNREKSRGLVENGSEIILSHRENMFSFEYVVLDFNDPRKNQSAYMLEGFHDQWIHTDWTNRVATFTNIPPGQYKFRVKGSNNHGVWNEEAISVSLVITPPFWQTWWFRALAVLLLSLFILLLHARRMRNLKARLKTEYEITRIYSKCGMTPREIEIIDLLKRKKSYKEIEDELFISYHTVKNHIYNIFKKLGVDNRAELIYYFKSIEDEMKRSDK